METFRDGATHLTHLTYQTGRVEARRRRTRTRRERKRRRTVGAKKSDSPVARPFLRDLGLQRTHATRSATAASVPLFAQRSASSGPMEGTTFVTTPCGRRAPRASSRIVCGRSM